jgi:hypothetical protein
MTPVNSSAISAVGHDPATNTLVVQFTSGDVYHYSDVPGDVHDQLLNADSIGKHFSANVRGQFAHRKI